MSAASSAKSSPIKGEIKVPGDKSISHRSLILGSQCIGTTLITGLLEGEDVLNTAESLRKLGVRIEKNGHDWMVEGVGVGGLFAPGEALHLGNSGTGVRLLMGLVASYPFAVKFTGDKSLSSRPMERIILPLKEMGVLVDFEDKEGYLPLVIEGNDELIPITYTLPVASAQVKSAILLASLNIAGRTTVVEPNPTRNHTELMLKYLGSDIEVNGNRITLQGQPELEASDIIVPGDPSSAAFFIVAALLVADSELLIQDICLNPLRIGLLDTLKEMGANIEYHNKREKAGEKIADIRVSYSKLKGVTVSSQRAPSMIDEYPILSVAAAFAEGKTRMEGLGELRVKESDRLKAIVDGLQVNGVKVESGEDWLEITGSAQVKGGGKIKTHMDHRIAMSFLVLGAASDNPVSIDDNSMISTSFPNFIELFNQIGGKIS